MIMINVENSKADFYSCGNLFSGFFDEQKVEKNSIYLKI